MWGYVLRTWYVQKGTFWLWDALLPLSLVASWSFATSLGVSCSFQHQAQPVLILQHHPPAYNWQGMFITKPQLLFQSTSDSWCSRAPALPAHVRDLVPRTQLSKGGGLSVCFIQHSTDIFAPLHQLAFMSVAAVPWVPRFIHPISALVLQICAAYR